MDLIDHLRLMARYNLWAYQRLWAEVDRLSEADYRARCGLFFAGIHGTLNHLLVVEQVWRSRLLGVPSTITGLDQIIEDDRARLRESLLAATAEWIDLCADFDTASLAQTLHYHNLKGEPFSLAKPLIPLHVFNHATHHRGQISAALTGLGGAAPVMDLPYFLLDPNNH